MDTSWHDDDVPLERYGHRTDLSPQSRRQSSPPTTAKPMPRFAQKQGRPARRLGMGVGAGAGAGEKAHSIDEDRERPRRVIGDGNIYGHSPTASAAGTKDTTYTDQADDANDAVHGDDDGNQDVEAALALALPTSPITESGPLRLAGGVGGVGRIGVGLGEDDEAYGGGLLRDDIDPFETGLGFGPGLEAAATYVLLPPVGPVALLVLEHRSDYVRFHAWQSALLFIVVFVVHVIFSWTAFISWTLFVCDLLLIGWLAFRAYNDASETLNRYKIPFFGSLASSIVDDE